MERLLVSMILPSAYAGRQRVLVAADKDPGWSSAETLDAGRHIATQEPRWVQEGFLAGTWLGRGPDECWLQERWLMPEHLLGSHRVEVVSWRMYFGEVFAEATIEEPNGQAGAAAATERMTVNSSPEPAGGIRLKGQDASGRIGFVFEPSGSFDSPA